MSQTVVESRSLPQVERLRSLARFLDSALKVPGTNYRFGLDAVVGLVPGIGDAIGALFSAYIVFQAARLGAPNSVLLRMMGNVAVDTLIGEIPLLGDLFDVGWKSNNRNVALLDQHLLEPVATRRSSRRVLVLIGLALLLLLTLVITLAGLVINLVIAELH